MRNSGRKRGSLPRQLPKCPTGILGLGEITGDGPRAGRPQSAQQAMRTAKTRAPARTPSKSSVARPLGKFVLRLFVAGATDRSRQAILRLRELCESEAELKDNCTLEVIDIYQQPALARSNQIVATPTLLIAFPPPMRRLIGNLANLTGLLIELDLNPRIKIAV